MNESLDSIAVRNQTDKASQFTRTYAQPHDYMRHLERFFEPLRHQPIKLLEIGCGGGESVRTWLDYFDHPDTRIFSVDLVCDTNEWNTRHLKPDPRYTFVHGDQSNSVFWASFIKMHGGSWDIIDDDGSHVSEHIVKTYGCLWPHLKSGGLYVIEDVKEPMLVHAMEQAYAGTADIDSIYFARELTILRKK